MELVLPARRRRRLGLNVSLRSVARSRGADAWRIGSSGSVGVSVAVPAVLCALCLQFAEGLLEHSQCEAARISSLSRLLRICFGFSNSCSGKV